MPAPIRNSQICATVPSGAADLCAKIKLVLVKLPHYICQQFSYIFNEDGSVSTEFKDAASPFPAGFILAAGLDSPPMGWLLCNGQAVSRTGVYAPLFAAYGTRFGAGDGSTTFNVPDIRDKTIIGVSASHPMGWTGGAETHTLVLAETPAHQHQVAGRALDDEGTDRATAEVIIDNDWQGNQTTKTTDDRGSNQPHNNMQPSFALNYFVKY